MLKKKIQDALNQQIRNEFASSFLYLSMSAFSESRNLKGFATWMRKQSDEERNHAMRLFDFVMARQGQVILDGLPKPASDFGDLESMCEEFQKHEREVSESINQLYALAVKEQDYATQVELHWFIEEQVEEEESAADLLARTRMAGKDRAALLRLDSELGERGDS